MIEIKPIPGTSLAESKDEAKQIREEQILPLLAEGKTVTLDFSEVGFATQSFIHALVSKAVHRYKEESFELLEFRACTPAVQQTVLTVFEYTLAASDAAEEVESNDPTGSD